MTDRITIFVCNPWDSYMDQLQAQSDEEWAEHELEMNFEDAQTLRARAPAMFEERAVTDPFWPPPELNDLEECEPDPALVSNG